MNDPIADMLTRIRNAVSARHPRVDIPYSGPKRAIAEILKRERYVGEVAIVEDGPFRTIRLTLRYDEEGAPFLAGLERVSRPGKRVYAGYRDIPQVMGGRGVAIVSTPRGLMSGREARKSRVGGEIVCNVW